MHFDPSDMCLWKIGEEQCISQIVQDELTINNNIEEYELHTSKTVHSKEFSTIPYWRFKK